jgi:hypothetical protein
MQIVFILLSVALALYCLYLTVVVRSHARSISVQAEQIRALAGSVYSTIPPPPVDSKFSLDSPDYQSTKPAHLYPAYVPDTHNGV